ncbi:MAG: hypothetical protein KAV45_08825 [Calditrichia bacterium]|nr:hypothetical protein [Calditrichia bacterium]
MPLFRNQKGRQDKYFFAMIEKRFEVYSNASFLCDQLKHLIHKPDDDKEKIEKTSKAHIENILNIFNVTSVDKRILELSPHANFDDYEDAVIHEAALRSNLDGIVTRNQTDFKGSKIPIFDPEELVKILRS